MKVHIPAFEPMAKCNEHLKHGPIDIDLGPDVVKVVRCKDCKHYKSGSCECHSVWSDEYSAGYDCGPDDFCSIGQHREDSQCEK